MEEIDVRTHIPSFRASTPLVYKRSDSNPRSIFEIAQFKYECSCKMCRLESSYLFSHKPSKSSIPTSPSLKGFTWLLERLSDISNDNSIRLNTPDIALFRFGRATSYIQTTREKLLKCSKSYDRLKIQEVTKQISNISRTRRREELQNNRLMISSAGVETSKEIACVRYMAKDCSNDQDELSCFEEEGALKVMSENEFTALAWERPSSSKWKTIAYIQSVLKCKNSIGESFVHSYRFQEHPNLPDLQGNFSDEEDLGLFLTSPEKYCEVIFLRIYAYLEIFSNIRLKTIQGEFVKDENNRIWLVHARHIDFYQKPFESGPVKRVVTESVESPVKDLGPDLIYHLELASKEPKNPRTVKLSEYMKEECEKIMKSTKFVDFFSHSRVERDSVSALEKLRTSHTGNFKQLKRSEVKRSSSEQKKLFITRGSEGESKYSSPDKKKSWVHVPRLKFSPLQDLRRRVSNSKSPILTQKTFPML